MFIEDIGASAIQPDPELIWCKARVIGIKY
jgi:hypothetical protein